MRIYRVVPSVWTLFIVVVLLASVHLSAAGRQQQEPPVKRYKIYCVNGKLEIGIRSPEDMKRARGTSACLKESHNSLLDAKKAAKKYGGVGAACNCDPNNGRRSGS